MQIKNPVLLIAVFSITSCTTNPDSKTHLYAFETAELTRKSWGDNSQKHNFPTPVKDTIPQPQDSVLLDSILYNSK